MKYTVCTRVSLTIGWVLHSRLRLAGTRFSGRQNIRIAKVELACMLKGVTSKNQTMLGGNTDVQHDLCLNLVEVTSRDEFQSELYIKPKQIHCKSSTTLIISFCHYKICSIHCLGARIAHSNTYSCISKHAHVILSITQCK